jgi:membrane-associated phospholipid phosphatase
MKGDRAVPTVNESMKTVRRVKLRDIEAFAQSHGRWAVTGAVAIGLLASAATLATLVEFHDEVIEPNVKAVDNSGLATAYALHSPVASVAMQILTTAGSVVVLTIVVAIGVIALALRKQWYAALGLALALGGAGLLNSFLKLWFHRSRPDVSWALASERSFSFPSGHAMLSLATYGMITYLLWRRFPRPLFRVISVALAILLILGIGVSRVYLGVHYPSDIIAGFLAGAIWLTAVIVATEGIHLFLPLRHPLTMSAPAAS